MASRAFDCDVLVVGLGPVGAAMAALLARRGVTVIALERDRTIYPLPRAVHFDHEIMRVFQELGVADEVARHSRPNPGYEFRAADGQLLLSFAPELDAPCGWASGYMFHQPSLEIALRDILAVEPTAEMRIGWRFEGLEQDARGVTAWATGPGGPTPLRARYLIGCDGGASPVRRALGIGLADYGFDEPWLVVDAKVQPGARTPELNIQICDPERPITCVLSGPGRHRWEFMLLPGEQPEDLQQDEVIERLIAPFGCGPLEIERSAVYRFHGLVAEHWRAGRVLLAGDAAHQTPPFAGQGMCSGIRDAANLAWKLEAVLAGEADAGLLDTYQPEREPHARALIELAIGMGRVVCALDRQAAAARDRDMLARRAAGAPPPLAYEFFGEDVLRRANLLSFGHSQLPTLDLARADYLLSFGADFLGTWNSPVSQSIGYGEMRQGRPGRRGRFAQIESRMSQTGANADEWIPCRPGTEGVLALGIANVILQDKEFVHDAHSRPASLIAGWSDGLPDFTPEMVEKQTGVSAAAIARLAHDLTRRSRTPTDCSTRWPSMLWNHSWTRAATSLLCSASRPRFPSRAQRRSPQKARKAALRPSTRFRNPCFPALRTRLRSCCSTMQIPFSPLPRPRTCRKPSPKFHM